MLPGAPGRQKLAAAKIAQFVRRRLFMDATSQFVCFCISQTGTADKGQRLSHQTPRFSQAAKVTHSR